MAIIATHHFIRQHDYTDCLKLAELLLDDEHDLIRQGGGLDACERWASVIRGLRRIFCSTMEQNASGRPCCAMP